MLGADPTTPPGDPMTQPSADRTSSPIRRGSTALAVLLAAWSVVFTAWWTWAITDDLDRIDRAAATLTVALCPLLVALFWRAHPEPRTWRNQWSAVLLALLPLTVFAIANIEHLTHLDTLDRAFATAFYTLMAAAGPWAICLHSATYGRRQ